MKRIAFAVLVFIIACLLTYDAANFPDINTDYTSACSSSSQSPRLIAAQAKIIIPCPEGDIKIKCDVNTELCAMMAHGEPSLTQLKLIKTSFLADYLLLSAVVDGKEVSYQSSVETAMASAYKTIWTCVALLWAAFFVRLFVMYKNRVLANTTGRR